ncbi:MAG TPA: polysaccharide biosynthesis tyrosine autokinase [Leptolyngbyaceae cyanobacterium M33_DOE_097]|uniref:Polysaccharide biosynthesis tyrosine autokinase n=1 Tax=Oscillatoriales cyanobacterium SpSt-418 TaxID=2282169 RepID=A0A7C3KG81_9CYAN|nr:polysaccharide biosynthesis tyrosine autokinase [Leptolyngbyaceae cyanobacterium M33_DOE_097]
MQANTTGFNPTVDNDAGYGQIFAILLRRRLWILGVLLGAISVAAVQTSRQDPSFISSMQLLVEPNYQGKQNKPSDLEDQFSDTNVEIDSGTQINLMQSSTLLRKAMQRLQTQYPEFDPNDLGSIGAFKKSLSVSQVLYSAGSKKGAETKIFQITYTDNDPVKTQDVLAAMKQVYLDYNLEQQKARLVRGLAFVNQQLPEIERKVQQAEAALEKFRREQALVDPDLQAKAQTESLLRVQQERQTNLVLLRDLQTRYTNLQRQVALSPQQAVIASRLSQSPRYQAVLSEIQKTELALAQQRARFKDSTPYVQQILDLRQRQLGNLQAEAQRILGSAAVTQGNGEGLLSQGQLAGADLALIGQMLDAQTNLQASLAREQALSVVEQQLRSELTRFPELLAEYGRLQPDIELSRETLKQLLKAQQDIGLEIARGGFDWQVVEEPRIGAKLGPSLLRNLLLGAIAGLLLGGVAAFAREAMDDAVHTSEDLKKQVPVPLLGTVPAMTIANADEEQPLININLPFRKPSPDLAPPITSVVQWQPFRESMDLLYQNIQLLSLTSPFKSLVITSALAGEGKSTLILGLAISAARLHQRVMLIDADLRRPSLHKLLGLPNDRGLSTLLSSNAPLPKQMAAQSSHLRSNISVLTAGPTPGDPAKLLSSQRMRDIIATFEDTYDLVLLDAPPLIGMVDAMLTASRCNGVLLVGRINQVTRAELIQATTMLNKLNVIGVVANGTQYQTRNSTHYQAAILILKHLY